MQPSTKKFKLNYSTEQVAEKILCGDLLFLWSLFYFSFLKPSKHYANEVRVPVLFNLNCTKELNMKIYNIFLSHLYFYKLFITPVIFLINALNGLYLSVKLKRVYCLFQMYFDRIT